MDTLSTAVLFPDALMLWDDLPIVYSLPWRRCLRSYVDYTLVLLGSQLAGGPGRALSKRLMMVSVDEQLQISCRGEAANLLMAEISLLDQEELQVTRYPHRCRTTWWLSGTEEAV
jgi:hypothetical protein